MWLASLVTPSVEVPAAVRALAGAIPAGVGLLAISVAVFSFRRARTTLSPMAPAAASSLVTSGVYRFTRNPMYLGLLLVLVGWADFLASPIALVLTPGFVLYMNRCQILPEERALLATFGVEYAAYKGRVRRWLWSTSPLYSSPTA